MNLEPVTPEELREEYTDQENTDLGELRTMRKYHKGRRRSGDPRTRASARAYLEAIEIEVRKIHRAAEMRVRLKGLGVDS